jgi:hypothetical protein
MSLLHFVRMQALSRRLHASATSLSILGSFAVLTGVRGVDGAPKSASLSFCCPEQNTLLAVHNDRVWMITDIFDLFCIRTQKALARQKVQGAYWGDIQPNLLVS